MNFIGNFFLFPVVNFFANPLRLDDVTTMSLVAPFLEHGVEAGHSRRLLDHLHKTPDLYESHRYCRSLLGLPD